MSLVTFYLFFCKEKLLCSHICIARKSTSCLGLKHFTTYNNQGLQIIILSPSLLGVEELHGLDHRMDEMKD